MSTVPAKKLSKKDRKELIAMGFDPDLTPEEREQRAYDRYAAAMRELSREEDLVRPSRFASEVF